ncbi:hypothetical protein BZL30_9402 [Mycobacterium kansasii]|uniref:Uncharacterized protein n=1 Tax=Mycobacterium kansasii TaxID=1768 RepID=A0A1V3W9Z3_MYCKA|nr:hypothetical protein BZL30_9402 [Mycobacterium kansasii]
MSNGRFVSRPAIDEVPGCYAAATGGPRGRRIAEVKRIRWRHFSWNP